MTDFRKRAIPTGDILERLLAELVETVECLERGVPFSVQDEKGKKRTVRSPSFEQVMRLLSAARRDGYRTQRLDVGAPSTVLDDEGHPMPPLSDPTGELAASDAKVADPIRYLGEDALRGVTGALGDLRMVRNALISCSRFFDTNPGEPGCSSHARIQDWEPVDRNGRCAWCYRFWLSEDIDPPLELLKARSEGRRITAQMVEAALRPRKRGKGKRGRRREKTPA